MWYGLVQIQKKNCGNILDLYRLVPDLIKEAGQMRETVQREQIFDTAALRYRPLYNQLERLLSNYQFNENALFAQTMMSWATLAGFGAVHQNKESGLVAFDENNFSVKSAQNSFLIPPSWDHYLNKKQNEIAIRVQRGVEEEKQKHIFKNNRMIKGSFDRDVAIKNDYIHFYAPGDEIFDCITDNAMHSYKGSRWTYLENLLRYVIERNRCDELLCYMFNLERFYQLESLTDCSSVEKKHQEICSAAIDRINAKLALGRHELQYIGGHFYITETGKMVQVESPNIKHIDVPYVQGLEFGYFPLHVHHYLNFSWCQ